jgi:protein TonB
MAEGGLVHRVIRQSSPSSWASSPIEDQGLGPAERNDQGARASAIQAATVSTVVQERRVVIPTVAAHPPVTARTLTAQPRSKADYSWLTQDLWARVERLKRYPRLARLNGWEGKVVVRAVIREDGHLAQLSVVEGSGHHVLDQEALELVKHVFPLALAHPLGQPKVVVDVPIEYRIEE